MVVRNRAVASAQLGYKHQKVQRLRKLLRRRDLRETEGVFVIEGYKLLEEALLAGAEIESVFVSPGASHEVLDRVSEAGHRIYELEPDVIQRVADTVTPQPVIATVSSAIEITMDRLPAVADSAVVLVDVRDPGNAGTIMRRAEAAGIGAVVFCDGSVDPFNPKTVRAWARAAIFHVKIVTGSSASESIRHLKAAGFIAVGTAMEGDRAYDACDLTRKVALLLGNEANGLDDDVFALLDETVSIPIEGRSESLNVSMAAAVLCFEVSRQRRSSR